MAFATMIGTVNASAPVIAIQALAGVDGQLRTPYHCVEAISTDG